MGGYDIQQVCLNGHQITAYYNEYPQHRKTYCDQCGEKTIIECQSCGAKIKGRYDVAGFVSARSTPVPSNCEGCGKPFPWTKKQLDIDSLITKSEVQDKTLLIDKICSRFHLVVKQIKSRHDSRETLVVNDEYDVQDLMHSLLRIFFEDIREEEWTPSYAGSSSRVDFLLKEEQTVIEIKKTRKNLKKKELGQQLIIDKERYRTHPDCKILICFAYDPEGWITNPKELENDLNEDKDGFKVKVIIVPKGH